MDVVKILSDLFAHYGYWIVFFGVMLENFVIPIPGETSLLLAGFFASSGNFSIYWVIVLAFVGSVTGDNLSYWVGRKVGRDVVVRYGRRVGLTQKRLCRMEAYFQRHGDVTILFARFITWFRGVAGLIAGTSNMHWPKFALFNVLGAMLWAPTIAFIGYFFGQNFHALEKWSRWSAVAIIALIVAGFLLHRLRKAKGKVDTPK